MRTPINIMLVVAAIAALIAASVGFKHQLASEKADKKALAAVLEKNTALRTQIASVRAAAPVPRQTDAPAKSAAQKNRLEREAFWQEGRKAFEAQKINDREFGLKYYASIRSGVDAQYGPFYRLHQFTKEQADALSEALFQKALRYDQANIDKQMGGSDTDAQAATADADAEFAAAAQAALGADLYAQFQLYERQRPAWDFVGNLGNKLSNVDMPLSLEQAARLAEAVANANTSFQKGGTANMNQRTPEVDWDAVDAAAADFLTPEQLDYFKNNNQPRLNMELNTALRKAGFKGGIGDAL